MRAWQITDSFSIDGLRLNEWPDRDPGSGEVAIGIKAVSLNWRDVLVVKGHYSKKLPLPLTICSDGAGVVEAVGAGVSRVREGDRVAPIFMAEWIAGRVTEPAARSARGAFTPGVLATRIVVQAESVVKIPGHLDFAGGASLVCAGVTAWNALIEEGELRAGETVLVQGSGGVSVFALQLARAAGARVMAITSTDERAARLRELGAEHVVNYTTHPDWEEAARKWSGGGVDHVVEIGGAATMNKSIRACRMGGRIALIGNRAEGGGEVNLTAALMKGVRIQGVFVGSREMFERMNRAVEACRLEPVVDRVFRMAEGVEAVRHLERGAQVGKVAIAVE